MNTQHLATKQEVAERFKVSPSVIQKLIDNGTLPAYRLGPHTWRLDPREVDAALRIGPPA